MVVWWEMPRPMLFFLLLFRLGFTNPERTGEGLVSMGL